MFSPLCAYYSQAQIWLYFHFPLLILLTPAGEYLTPLANHWPWLLPEEFCLYISVRTEFMSICLCTLYIWLLCFLVFNHAVILIKALINSFSKLFSYTAIQSVYWPWVKSRLQLKGQIYFQLSFSTPDIWEGHERSEVQIMDLNFGHSRAFQGPPSLLHERGWDDHFHSQAGKSLRCLGPPGPIHPRDILQRLRLPEELLTERTHRLLHSQDKAERDSNPDLSSAPPSATDWRLPGSAEGGRLRKHRVLVLGSRFRARAFVRYSRGRTLRQTFSPA